MYLHLNWIVWNETFCMLNWFVWNGTDYLYKNRIGIKYPTKVDMSWNTNNQPSNTIGVRNLYILFIDIEQMHSLQDSSDHSQDISVAIGWATQTFRFSAEHHDSSWWFLREAICSSNFLHPAIFYFPHIYIYIYIYEVHTISFQTFFVWAFFIDSTLMKL